VAAAMSGGEDFLGRQLYFENLKRFSGGENVNNKPWWFYADVYLRTALPWSLLSIVAAWRWLTTPRRDEVSSEKKMLLGWIGVGLVFFSAASGKRDAYLLPLLPAVALVAAWYMVDLFRRLGEGDRARMLRIPSHVGLGAMICAAVAMLGFAIIVRTPPFEDETAAYVQVLLTQVEFWFMLSGTFVLFVGLLLSRERQIASPRQWGVTWGLVSAVLLFGLAFGLRVKYELKNYRGAAAEILAIVQGAPLTVIKDRYDELFDPVLYYFKREVNVVESWPTHCIGFLLTRTAALRDRIGGENAKANQLTPVFRTSPIPDLIKGKTEREMSLFRCPSPVTPRASYRFSPAP
jgi:hypothetical protein